jgi:hypothetical protein
MKRFLWAVGDSGRVLIYRQQEAPIAHEGFFATHFFTVGDLEKSKDFYLRILGGKVIKPDNPCYIKLANTWILLNSGGGPTPDKPEGPSCRRHLGLLQTMRRQRSILSYRAIRQSRPGMALLDA